MKTLRRMLAILPLVLAMNCKPNPPITTLTGQNHSPSANLVINPLSGEAPLTANISLTGTDEDGDAITYSIKIDDNSDGTIDYIKEELSPIQIERTFNAGKATIYGKCSDPDGLRSELEQEVMISRPTPGNVLPTATLLVNPTSGQYPLTVNISLDGEDSDGQIREYKLEIDVQDGKTDAKDEIIKQSTPINLSGNLSKIFEPGNVMIYGTVTDDKGGKVIKGESIQVSERNDLVGEIAFAEGGYAVGDYFLFSGTVRNNTNTNILVDNANKDSLEYKLIRYGTATPSLDINFEEDATITLHENGYVTTDYFNRKVKMGNIDLIYLGTSLVTKKEDEDNEFSLTILPIYYPFDKAGEYTLEVIVKYSMNNTPYHVKINSPTFNVAP